jgi:hypothetical protein
VRVRTWVVLYILVGLPHILFRLRSPVLRETPKYRIKIPVSVHESEGDWKGCEAVRDREIM